MYVGPTLSMVLYTIDCVLRENPGGVEDDQALLSRSVCGTGEALSHVAID